MYVLWVFQLQKDKYCFNYKEQCGYGTYYNNDNNIYTRIENTCIIIL